jgi:hypothetical protein
MAVAAHNRPGPNAVQKRLRRTVSEAVVIDQQVYTVPRHDAFPGNSACHSTRVLSRSPRDLRSVSRPAIGRSDSAACWVWFSTRLLCA